MNKPTPVKYFRICLDWLWTAIRLKRLKFRSLEADQELLFENAAFRLIWNMEGAYLVKLFFRDQKVAEVLPGARPVIPTAYAAELRVRACGVFRTKEQMFSVPVKPLSYQQAPGAALTAPCLRQPSMVSDVTLRLANIQSLTLQPRIATPGVILETSLMQREEEALQSRMLLFQEQMKVNP